MHLAYHTAGPYPDWRVGSSIGGGNIWSGNTWSAGTSTAGIAHWGLRGKPVPPSCFCPWLRLLVHLLLVYIRFLRRLRRTSVPFSPVLAPRPHLAASWCFLPLVFPSSSCALRLSTTCTSVKVRLCTGHNRPCITCGSDCGFRFPMNQRRWFLPTPRTSVLVMVSLGIYISTQKRPKHSSVNAAPSARQFSALHVTPIRAPDSHRRFCTHPYNARSISTFWRKSTFGGVFLPVFR